MKTVLISLLEEYNGQYVYIGCVENVMNFNELFNSIKKIYNTKNFDLVFILNFKMWWKNEKNNLKDFNYVAYLSMREQW